MRQTDSRVVLLLSASLRAIEPATRASRAPAVKRFTRYASNGQPKTTIENIDLSLRWDPSLEDRIALNDFSGQGCLVIQLPSRSTSPA
jgi:hypothetical protein